MTQSIQVSPSVWSAWRQWDEADTLYPLRLRFVSQHRPRVVASALHAITAELVKAFERLPQDDPDYGPPSFGAWESVWDRDAVYLSVTDFDDFKQSFRALIKTMEREGIAGTFDIWEPVTVYTESMVGTGSLTCEIRVAGNREPLVPRGYRWRPDRQAHEAVVGAGIAWTRGIAEQAEHALKAGTVDPIPLRADDPDLEDRIFETFERGYTATVMATDSRSARWAHGQGPDGSVKLTTFGDAVGENRWEDEVAALTDVLRSCADSIAFASITRDWARWPIQPLTPFIDTFEDLYARDAFGIQLLGPGYDGRVPRVTLWHPEQIRDTATLLIATDLRAWYGPTGGTQETEPSPLLDRARTQLAPILYRMGALTEAGFEHVDPY